MALGQKIPNDLKSLFCVALADLTERQLRLGFNDALKFWKPEFGKRLPAPAEIREYAERYESVDPIAETRRKYLELEAKPANWEPVTEQELAEFRARLAQAALSAQIPQEYGDMAEALAGERNGKTEVPEDLIARKAWATDKAKQQGWL